MNTISEENYEDLINEIMEELKVDEENQKVKNKMLNKLDVKTEKFHKKWQFLFNQGKIESKMAVKISLSAGNIYFKNNFYVAAIQEYIFAACSLGAKKNAYVSLRLGQCQYELKLLKEAKINFTEAFEVSPKIFKNIDPKYIKLINHPDYKEKEFL